MVLASGNGSNFQALIDAVQKGDIPNSRISQLVVNRAKAYATKRAEAAGIPWEYFNLIANGFQSKAETDPAKVVEARKNYDAALAKKILESGDCRPHLIVLAGWMYIFGEHFLDPITAAGIKVINLHPALPGQYDGANAIERAYADFEAGMIKQTGIMVHYVIKEVDRGDPIMSRIIDIEPGETLEQLKDKVHRNEHDLIVQATASVANRILASEAA